MTGPQPLEMQCHGRLCSRRDVKADGTDRHPSVTNGGERPEGTDTSTEDTALGN